MKNTLKLFAAVLMLGLFAASALPARAQVTPLAYAGVYNLTNATTFTLTTGGTNLAAGALTVINSQPFPVRPGRGFSVVTSFIGTNATTAAVTPYFQFATPVTIGGTLTTNWQTGYVNGGAISANGTTRVYGYSVVPPTTVDNAVLGRLSVVSNAHDASVTFNATNCFVIVTY